MDWNTKRYTAKGVDVLRQSSRVLAPVDRFGNRLAPCINPLCDRWVSTTVVSPYCCGGGQKAHEGRYESHEGGPLGHTAFCNDRCAERGTQFKRPAPKLEDLP